MIIPDRLDFTQADYLAAIQAIAILENRAGKLNRIVKLLEKPSLILTSLPGIIPGSG